MLLTVGKPDDEMDPGTEADEADDLVEQDEAAEAEDMVEQDDDEQGGEVAQPTAAADEGLLIQGGLRG